MKKLTIIFIALALFCSYSFAMMPPKAVKKAFDKKFPAATKITWSTEAAKEKEWEAGFTFNGTEIVANFYEDGTWLETGKEIKVSALPAAIAAAIKTNFSVWTVIEAYKTQTNKHEIIYEANMLKGAIRKSVAYKENGTLVKE